MTAIIPVDYTSKDFDGFRQSMLDYASVTFPEWTGRSRADFGVTLVDLFAYMGDILSYYGDRIANEAFISTATQRSSLLAHASLLGYTPFGYVASTGTVTFKTDAGQGTAVVLPAGTKVSTDYIAEIDGSLVFETNTEVTVPATGGQVTANVTQGETQGSTAKILNAGAANQANINVVQIGTSDATLDQKFILPNSPVIEGSVRVFVDDTASGNPAAILEWVQVASLLSAGPDDRVYSVKVEENGTTSATLGDGVNGYIPPTGVRVYAVYRTGGGVRGNLDINTVRNFVNAVVGVSVLSSSAMTGGSDMESNDSIRTNAPRAFRVQNRAVTLQDYSDLALTVASVAKARAVASGVGSVTVFIVGPSGAAPSSTLLADVQAVLDARTMVGTSVTVLGGTKIFINLGTDATPIKVGVYPHFATTDIQAAAESAILELLSPARVDLGMRFAVSDVYAKISAIPGVAYVVIPMVARSTDPQTGVNDVLCREWEYPSVGTVRVAAEAAQQ